MSIEKTSLENESQPSCLGAVISRFNSDTFIDNVCLSYRHDFGLMAEQDRQKLRFECKEWMRAISNNWEYHEQQLKNCSIPNVAGQSKRCVCVVPNCKNEPIKDAKHGLCGKHIWPNAE